MTTQDSATAAGNVIAAILITVMLGGIIAAFVIWGWETVIAAVLLVGVAKWWMFDSWYNNPGKSRR